MAAGAGAAGGGGGGGEEDVSAERPYLFKVNKEVMQGLRLSRIMGQVAQVQQHLGRAEKNAEEATLNSIDFHNSEMLLVAADDTDALSLYDIAEGKRRGRLISQKYGVRNVICTRSSNNVLHSSKPSSSSSAAGDVIRYWSLHTNTYVRYFPGHSKPVTSLCMAPDSDAFMSAGLDEQVYVWDLKKKGAAAVLPATGKHPYAQYDHQGLVAAIATEDAIRLFDIRYWEKGPFIKFQKHPWECKCMRFSNDGGKLLVVGGGTIKVLDAIVGTELFSMNNNCKPHEQPEACFDPSSEYVLSGCQDGYVRVWRAPGGSASDTCGIGEDVSRLHVPHKTVPRVLKWAPTCLLLASGGEDLRFWVPEVEVLARQHENEG